MATYDWIGGLPIKATNAVYDWVGGLPYIISNATVTMEAVTITGTADITASIKKGAITSGKWSGLGMVIFSIADTAVFDGYVNDCVANGFTELRIDIPDYQTFTWYPQSKAAVIRAIAAHPTIKIIWGVSSNKKNNAAYEITAANWPTFRAAILTAAQWAQDNGVYEFQLGNEEEIHNDDTTLTDAQLIVNLKSVATDAQAIFTNGNISYSCNSTNIAEWVAAGRGDIDIIASNISKYNNDINDGTWDDKITALVAGFGVDHTYLTEFDLNWPTIDGYSADEAVQAAAVTEMFDYVKASGMTRACWFQYIGDTYGARKSDGTYRKLWYNLLTSSAPVIAGTSSITSSIKKGAISSPVVISGTAAITMGAFIKEIINSILGTTRRLLRVGHHRSLQ